MNQWRKSFRASWLSSLLLLAGLLPLVHLMALLAVSGGMPWPVALAACHGALLAVLLLRQSGKGKGADAAVFLLGFAPWGILAWPLLDTDLAGSLLLLLDALAMVSILSVASLFHGLIASGLEEGHVPGRGVFGPFASIQAGDLPLRDRASAVALLLAVFVVTAAVAFVLTPDSSDLVSKAPGPVPLDAFAFGPPSEPLSDPLKRGLGPGLMLALTLLGLPQFLVFLISGRAWVSNLFGLAPVVWVLVFLMDSFQDSIFWPDSLVVGAFLGVLASPFLFYRFALPVLARRAFVRRTRGLAVPAWTIPRLPVP